MFDPRLIINSLNAIIITKYDGRLYDIIRGLHIFSDAGFLMLGDVDEIVNIVNKSGYEDTIKEIIFIHEDLTDIWISWITAEHGDITISEGRSPWESEEILDMSPDEFFAIASSRDLLEWVKQEIGDSEVPDDRSWAECLEALADYEINSDENDLKGLQEFIDKLQLKNAKELLN